MDLGRNEPPIPAAQAFFRPAMFLGWNPGEQHTVLGIGGPQGFALGTVQQRPWPYLSGTRKFIMGFPYGSASTLIQPRAWPYTTASRDFKQDAWLWKPSTGPGIVF